MIYKLRGIEPKIGEDNFIADSAKIIGEVVTGKDVSIWYSAIIRADLTAIYIGDGSNIQENATLHGDPGFDVVVGKNVTIGHNCIIHGAKIGENSIVGMGSTVLDGVVLPRNSFVGANSLVTSSLKAEEGYLILGSPARAVRKLSEKEIKNLKESAEDYIREKNDYLNTLERIK